MERKVKGGPVWEMRHDQGIWHPSMLVKYNEVRDVVGTASFRKVLYYVVSPINPVRIGEDQAHLLGKLQQLRARVPRRSQDDLRVKYSRS